MRTICVTSLDELADYEEGWESLRRRCGGSVFTSYPLCRAWLEAFRSVAEPRVIIVEDQDGIAGLGPFFLQRSKRAGVPIRLLSLIGDADGKLGISPLQVMCAPDHPDALGEVMTSIKDIEWNILRAQFMEDVQEVRRFLDVVKESWRWEDQKPSSIITCSLPETGDIMDGFGKATRKKMRKTINGLEKEGRLAFRSIQGTDIDPAVDIHVKQHLERWQTKGGSIFEDPLNVGFFRAIMKESISRGAGSGFELLIDGEVAAQQFLCHEGSAAYGYRSGMSNALAIHSPGSILTYYVMTELRDRGFRSFNLGEGDQEYKHHLGGQESSLIGLRAKRGLVSALSWVAGSSSVKRLDELMGSRSRSVKDAPGNGERE